MFRRVGSGHPVENDEWVQKVINAMSDFHSSTLYEEDFVDDYDLDMISRIFGIYEKRVEAEFNGMFKRV